MLAQDAAVGDAVLEDVGVHLPATALRSAARSGALRISATLAARSSTTHPISFEEM